MPLSLKVWEEGELRSLRAAAAAAAAAAGCSAVAKGFGPRLDPAKHRMKTKPNRSRRCNPDIEFSTHAYTHTHTHTHTCTHTHRHTHTCTHITPHVDRSDVQVRCGQRGSGIEQGSVARWNGFGRDLLRRHPVVRERRRHVTSTRQSHLDHILIHRTCRPLLRILFVLPRL